MIFRLVCEVFNFVIAYLYSKKIILLNCEYILNKVMFFDPRGMRN